MNSYKPQKQSEKKYFGKKKKTNQQMNKQSRETKHEMHKRKQKGNK